MGEQGDFVVCKEAITGSQAESGVRKNERLLRERRHGEEGAQSLGNIGEKIGS